jgi:hypothetical protein
MLLVSQIRRSCFLVLSSIHVLGTPSIMFGQTPNSTQEPAPTSPDLQAPESVARDQSIGRCVPAMPDYPAFQSSYGNPYRIMDCRNGDCESTKIERWKRSMQSSHWGYPEYFHRNTYGHAHRNAFANNIRDGAIERATLYHLDFYPEDSPYAHMLTPKGLEKLEKAICVSNTFGSPLKVEKSNNPELNEKRRQWLSEQSTVAQAGILPDSIWLTAKPMGIQATEAIRNYQQGISPRSANQGMANQGMATGFPVLPGAGSSMNSPIPR